MFFFLGRVLVNCFFFFATELRAHLVTFSFVGQSDAKVYKKGRGNFGTLNETSMHL